MSVKLEDGGLNRNSKITTIANMSPVFSKESDSIDDVVDKMISTGHRRIPIVSKNGGFVGIVTKSDILDAFLKKQDFDEKVSTIMVRDVIYCNSSDTLEFVLQKFKISRRGGFPILDGDRLVGMVSERDYVKHFSGVNFGLEIKRLMTRKPLYIHPNISVYDCLKIMVNTKYRRLPVVGNGELIGLVTSADLLNYIKKNNYNSDKLDESVDRVTIKNVYTISEGKNASEAIKTMKSRDVGGILVVSKGKLEGIITERDILEEII